MINLKTLIKEILEGDTNMYLSPDFKNSGSIDTVTKGIKEVEISEEVEEPVYNDGLPVADSEGNPIMKTVTKTRTENREAEVSKTINIPNLTSGLQNKSKNSEGNDKDMTVAESLTIAWPIYKYINKLETTVEDLEAKVKALEDRVKALESPITPIQ